MRRVLSQKSQGGRSKKHDHSIMFKQAKRSTSRKQERRGGNKTISRSKTLKAANSMPRKRKQSTRKRKGTGVSRTSTGGTIVNRNGEEHYVERTNYTLLLDSLVRKNDFGQFDYNNHVLDLDFSVLSLSDAEVIELAVRILVETLPSILDEEKVKDYGERPEIKNLRFRRRPRNIVTTDDLEQSLPFPENLVFDLVMEIKKGYTKTCFHNFDQAVDGMQMMHLLLNEFCLERIEPHRIFFILFACLCKNIKHPGASMEFLHENAFLTEYDTIEDLHAAEAVRLIESHTLFTHLMRRDFEEEFIETCTSLIGPRKEYDASVLDNMTMNSKEPLQEVHLVILMGLSSLPYTVRRFTDCLIWSSDVLIEDKSLEQIDMWETIYTAAQNYGGFSNVEIITRQLVDIQDDLKYSRKGVSAHQVYLFVRTIMDQTVEPIIDKLKYVDKSMQAMVFQRLRTNKLFCSAGGVIS